MNPNKGNTALAAGLAAAIGTTTTPPADDVREETAPATEPEATAPATEGTEAGDKLAEFAEAKNAADKPEFTLESPEIAAPLALMIEATAAEGAALIQHAAAIETAKGGAWDAIRTPFVGVLTTYGVKAAALLLAGYKKRAATESYEKRANQYAADLNRMVRARTEEHELPALLLTQGRTAYLDNDFWKTSGVVKNKGPTAAKKEKAKALAAAAVKAVSGGKFTEADKKALQAAGTIGAAVAKAATDEALQNVLELIANLHGDFRAQALTEVKEVLLRISNTQALAGTGTK